MNNKYTTLALINNTAEHKLELPIPAPEGYAFVRYGLKDNHIDLHHIEVSRNLRGQGIASDLAAKVFEYIGQQGWTYTIYCSFLKTWKNRHEEA
jgi:predicted GNAT family acetyltransferase